MNFYAFHMGDYARSTAHLSWDEDLAYRRLLDLFYSSEAPIPADTNATCRLLRAQGPRQRAAIETVLKEYFTLTDAGWTQERCDQELAAAAQRRQIASCKAQRRWRGHGAARPEAHESEAPPASDAPQEVFVPPNAEPSAPMLRQRSSNAAAQPRHCSGNAPIPNPIPNLNPNPNKAAAAACAHAPPYAREASARDEGNAAAAALEYGGGEDGGSVVGASTRTAAFTPDTPIPDPPPNVAEWHKFFARLGFDAQQMGKLKTRRAMQSWADRRLSQAFMREVMQAALDRNGGLPPHSPAYYAPLVDDWLATPVERVRNPGLAAALRAMQPKQPPRPPIEAI